MSYLSNITLRRGVAMLIVALGILTAGTWMTVRLTTDHLLNSGAKHMARDWAQYLAANVTDLEQIAYGEQPSAASMTFFDSTRKAGQVFRYVIFNRQGYSQLVSDRGSIATFNLSEHDPQAERAIALGVPLVDVGKGDGDRFPAVYARAYVPAMIDGHPVAIVAAYVDQTAARAEIQSTFLLAAISLCSLTAFAFAIPAVAWYRRTREKQQADRRIRFLAHHDPLTGLANRARLIERLDGALATLPAFGGHLATHFIDLDRFKEVNDSLGHDAGDFLLTTLGQRLNALTRAEDIVARLGGDEFVVVQTGIADKTQAEAFALRILSILSEPMHFKEQEIKAGVTIGVALAPGDGQTSERLLKNADLALYTGKASGRNRVVFFVPEMDAAFQARRALEKHIREAVAGNGFVVHYQPVIEMSSNKLTGYEALVRLPAKDGALIPPASFIPIAEDTHLIDKIGAWVLQEACRTAVNWPDDLTVAVNLSPSQFEAGTIVEIVRDALNTSGLKAHRLELEITETLLLGDNERIMEQLVALKALGVSIVMDDFGTGYSSLSYLWKFPFDKIKIDRSFMQNFEESGHDVETVVKSIIALGRELRMRVTVEGVETSDQAEFLYDADADQVQGFFFGRPVPAAEIGAHMLADFRKTPPAAPAGKHPKPRIVSGGSKG